MFRRTGSIKLMDVAGIRIGVDVGWLLTLFIVIIYLSPSFRATLHSSDGVAYLTTVVSALLPAGGNSPSLQHPECLIQAPRRIWHPALHPFRPPRPDARPGHPP